MPSQEPLIKVERITPERAKEMLATNSRNRKLNKRHVDFLAHEMETGQWALNTDTIKFNPNGKLRDGQHRLAACIQANRTIQTAVAYGVPNKVFTTFDTGRKRSASDVLLLAGYHNTASLAAAITLVFARDRFEDKFKMNQPQGAFRPSSQEILNYAKKHPRIVELNDYHNNYRPLVMPPSVAAFLEYWFEDYDPDLSGWFFERLRDGQVDSNSPVAALIRTLLRLRSQQTYSRLQRSTIAALTIKAWNMCRNNQDSVRRITWRNIGYNAEEFPMPR